MERARSPAKIAATRGYGAEVLLYDRVAQSREAGGGWRIEALSFGGDEPPG